MVSRIKELSSKLFYIYGLWPLILCVGCQSSQLDPLDPSTTTTAPPPSPTSDSSGIPTFSPTPSPSITIPTPTPKIVSTPFATPAISPSSSISIPTISVTPKPIPSVKIARKSPDRDPEIFADRLITSEGIGEARIGMTLGELKQKLGDGVQYQVKKDFLDNHDALAVVQNGEIQYYIPYLKDAELDDTFKIKYIITENPKYQTIQGVRPGTPINQATKFYGDATLTYNVENESREYINFAQPPAADIFFRPKVKSDRDLAGIYEESNESDRTTVKYKEDTGIGQIIVSCDEKRNCE